MPFYWERGGARLHQDANSGRRQRRMQTTRITAPAPHVAADGASPDSGIDPGQSPSSSRPSGARADGPPSECVVIRTHRTHNHDAALARSLADQCRGRYDVYVQLNLRSREGDGGESDRIMEWWRRVCDECRIGLTHFCDDEVKRDHPYYGGAWIHGQHSFTSARSGIPTRYDRYWFFEYDARFDGNLADLVDEHSPFPHDLIGTWLGSWRDNREWGRWYDMPQRMREGGEGYPLEFMWKFFSILCRLSGRLLDWMAEEMLVGQWYIMQEPFVPTVCAARFGVDAMMDLLPHYWLRDTVRYRPVLGHPDEWERELRSRPEYRGKVVHPIKEDDGKI